MTITFGDTRMSNEIEIREAQTRPEKEESYVVERCDKCGRPGCFPVRKLNGEKCFLCPKCIKKVFHGAY